MDDPRTQWVGQLARIAFHDPTNPNNGKIIRITGIHSIPGGLQCTPYLNCRNQLENSLFIDQIIPVGTVAGRTRVGDRIRLNKIAKTPRYPEGKLDGRVIEVRNLCSWAEGVKLSEIPGDGEFLNETEYEMVPHDTPITGLPHDSRTIISEEEFVKEKYEYQRSRADAAMSIEEELTNQLYLEKEANLRLRYELSTRPLPSPPESILAKAVKRIVCESKWVSGVGEDVLLLCLAAVGWGLWIPLTGMVKAGNILKTRWEMSPLSIPFNREYRKHFLPVFIIDVCCVIPILTLLGLLPGIMYMTSAQWQYESISDQIVATSPVEGDKRVRDSLELKKLRTEIQRYKNKWK